MIGHFVEFTVDGDTQDVVVGENTADKPWVVLDSGGMQGSLGCNQFTGSYAYKDGVVVGGAGRTKMWCGDAAGSHMEFEFAFMRLWRGDPLVVSRAGDRMLWTSADFTLVLEEGLPTDQR